MKPQRLAALPPMVALAAGHVFACGREASGRVWCWGALGEDRWAPPRELRAAPLARRLVAGDRHGCAISDQGALWCWGDNDYGQLGSGTTRKRSKPIEVELPGSGQVDELWTSGATTFARTQDGAVLFWGYDASRDWQQNRDQPRKPSPWQPNGLRGTPATGDERCVQTTDGQVHCRKRGADDRLTDPFTTVALPGPARELAVGGQHACALGADGQVRCWGDNEHGQLGRSSARDGVAMPTLVAGIANVTEVVVGEWNACALHQGGRVSCWDRPFFSFVRQEPKALPPKRLAGISAASRLFSGGQYTCTRGPGAQTRCWGKTTWRACRWLSPDNCQSEDWPSPSKVKGLAGIAGAQEVCGECVRLATGAVQCVERYQGTTAGEQPPVDDAVELAGAAWLRCIRRRNGKALCAFPPGGIIAKPTWAELPKLGSVTDLSASATHVCAVHSAGKVSCTPPTAMSEICKDPKHPCAKPLPVGGIGNAIEVVTGNGFSCARLSTGKVACWGQGGQGVLGDGTTQDRAAPVLVLGLSDAVELDAREHHVCARRATGQVVCWGDILPGIAADPTPAVVSSPPAPAPRPSP